MSLTILSYWNDEKECNVYGVRGMGDDYNAFYKSLYTQSEPSRSAPRVTKQVYRSMWSKDDFPWDYIWFYDTEDELRFLECYNSIIEHEDSRSPRPPKVQPEGFTWCGRCHTFHENQPPWHEVEKQIIDRLAEEITKEIDAEILAELLAISKKQE